MVDNFSKFGKQFQLKLISCLLYDRVFMNQIHDIIKPEYFDSVAIVWIYEHIASYHKQYKVPPTLDVFRVYLNELAETDTTLHYSVIEAFKTIVREKDSDDLQFVKDESLNFCKNQVVKLAIMDSVTFLQDGKFDDIKRVISKALEAGVDHNVGHDYFLQWQDRFDEEIRNPIKTPWHELTLLLDGGLGSGELGVIIAPGGIGKSWFLCALGYGAMELGKKVLYFTLELRDTYIERRFDSIGTGIPFKQITDLSNRDRIKAKMDALEALGAGLKVTQYSAKSVGLSSLAACIEQCRSQGWNPDLVIIDYADEIRTTTVNRDRRDLELGDLYREIRALAQECQLPIWTASQANREGSKLDFIQADSIAGSYEKIMVADFIVSVARRPDDKLRNIARMHVVKNRFGADGMTFSIKFNTDNGHIEMFPLDSESNQKVSAASNVSKKDAETARLREKFAQFG